MSDKPATRLERRRKELADPAHGGTYKVTDLRSGRGGWDYEVAGYDRTGELLLKTVHKGETSMEMECAAWESRGATKKP